MPRYVIPTQSGGYIGVDGPVPYDDTQARFDALADSIAAQSRRPVPMTIQNMPVPRANAPMGPNAGPQMPVRLPVAIQNQPPSLMREARPGIQNYWNAPGAYEAQERYGIPPVLMQRSPYATAGYMAGPDGSVNPLVGYPSIYPHVLNGTPQNYAAPAMANAWSVLGPWLAPPAQNGMAQELLRAMTQRTPRRAAGGTGGGGTQRTTPAQKTAAPQQQPDTPNPPMGPNAGPQRPPVTAPAEVRGVYNPTPINTPNPPMGPNAGPQRPPVTAPAEVRGVYNPTPINTPQYTQGEVFEAAINQAAPDSIIRDLGQFDYDDYFVVPGGDASVGDTGTYADPYAPGAESREWYLLHGGNPDNVGRLGMSPLAQEVIEYTPPPAATAPEVRGTYNPTPINTPQLYGELGNAARSALTNEYRGAYNPEVRGPVHPSILSSR